MFYYSLLSRLIQLLLKRVWTNLGRRILSKNKQDRWIRGKLLRLRFYSDNDRFLDIKVA